jgi:hypothetical protein
MYCSGIIYLCCHAAMPLLAVQHHYNFANQGLATNIYFKDKILYTSQLPMSRLLGSIRCAKEINLRFLPELMPCDKLRLLQYDVHSVVFLLESGRLDWLVEV